MDLLTSKLKKVFKMNNEFLTTIKEDDLKLRLVGMRSDSIASQITCIIGCRDSYSKCLPKDEQFRWSPDFPHADRYNLSKLSRYLVEIGEKVISELESINELSDNQQELVLDLLSHEYQHQGQIIRYFYANGLKMPGAVKSEWHLED